MRCFPAAENEINDKQEHTSAADQRADFETGCMVGKDNLVVSGFGRNCHKAGIYLFDRYFFAVDCGTPALVIGDTEKDQVWLFQRNRCIKSL